MNQKQKDKLSDALGIISEIVDEEQEKLDNMYEKFSETQRYQDMEEDKDNLEEAKSLIEDLVNK